MYVTVMYFFTLARTSRMPTQILVHVSLEATPCWSKNQMEVSEDFHHYVGSTHTCQWDDYSTLQNEPTVGQNLSMWVQNKFTLSALNIPATS